MYDVLPISIDNDPIKLAQCPYVTAISIFRWFSNVEVLDRVEQITTLISMGKKLKVSYRCIKLFL